MKALDLRKKIVKNFSISGLILVIIVAIFFLNDYQKTFLEEKIKRTEQETSELTAKTLQLQNKIFEIKKYLAASRDISENKKSLNGIDIDEATQLMNKIAEKYSIKNSVLKATLPESLKEEPFERSKILVLLTTANLTFKAPTDIKALLFINEFLGSVSGYYLVKNLNIKKEKSYTSEDLVALSSGENKGNISGSIDFFWYAFQSKEPQAKKTDDINKNINDKTEETKTKKPTDENKLPL